MAVPNTRYLLQPILDCLHSLGGSVSIPEMEDWVGSYLKLSEKDRLEIHSRGKRTTLGYNLAWGRTNLKKYGLINNPRKAVWTLTEEGRKTTKVNKTDVMRANWGK